MQSIPKSEQGWVILHTLTDCYCFPFLHMRQAFLFHAMGRRARNRNADDTQWRGIRWETRVWLMERKKQLIPFSHHFHCIRWKQRKGISICMCLEIFESIQSFFFLPSAYCWNKKDCYRDHHHDHEDTMMKMMMRHKRWWNKIETRTQGGDRDGWDDCRIKQR
jgi:hypothetical protein